MPAREFDLNIERVLENWTVAHAIRELIANALDEAALTATAEPEIGKDADGRWHIRDFGRGLRYEHLTQNENREKLASPGLVVGKFGVGLKDALATFDRRGVGVRIRSRFGDITTAKQAKHDVEAAKSLFRHYAGDEVLEETEYGVAIGRPSRG
jgi:DNA gyrase/topoisomerase IV subunit B